MWLFYKLVPGLRGLFIRKWIMDYWNEDEEYQYCDSWLHWRSLEEAWCVRGQHCFLWVFSLEIVLFQHFIFTASDRVDFVHSFSCMSHSELKTKTHTLLRSSLRCYCSDPQARSEQSFLIKMQTGFNFLNPVAASHIKQQTHLWSSPPSEIISSRHALSPSKTGKNLSVRTEKHHVAHVFRRGRKVIYISAMMSQCWVSSFNTFKPEVTSGGQELTLV